MVFDRHSFMGRGRSETPFPRGVFRYIILDYLKNSPSHGYEIMRGLEERFHGLYAPSAGTIYPTLQMLEDMGYVTSTERDGKKTYTITDEGHSFLTERADLGDKIKERLNDWRNPENVEDLQQTMREYHRLRELLHWEARKCSPEKLSKVRDAISRAYKEVEEILKD